LVLLEKRLLPGFDRLMSYVERINGLNEGTSCALFAIQNEHVVAEYYAGRSIAELLDEKVFQPLGWNGESSLSLIGHDVPDNSFEIVGLYGPLVLVVPELDFVVVRMANRVGNYADERGTYIEYLKEFSNKAVHDAREALVNSRVLR